MSIAARQLLRSLATAFLASAPLYGCGLRVPDIAEVWDGPDGTKQLEFEIRRTIFCELKKAAMEAGQYYFEASEYSTGKTTSKSPLLPDDWVAELTLQLQVDESISANPGVAFNTPMHSAITNFGGEYLAPSGSALSTVTYPFFSTPQLYSLGLGATLSSTATRIDRINAYWTMGYLKKPPRANTACTGAPDPYLDPNNPYDRPSSSSPFLLQSELGIKKWLLESLENEKLLPSNKVRSSGAPTSDSKSGSSTGKDPDELQEEIKFVIVSSGNITPTWKLVRVSANTGAPLFGLGRTRTHDLLITIGPGKGTMLNTAGQIGQAVSSGVSSSGP